MYAVSFTSRFGSKARIQAIGQSIRYGSLRT
jgi:hypothetical protein